LITKPEEHEINRAGKLLLRQALESLGWVLNDVQEDYGIDTNLQVFDRNFPTGEWFHVQLKSSATSAYSSIGSFVSQELTVEHAHHYALTMRQPIFLIHADITNKKVYWHAPQLDRDLAAALNRADAKSITIRIPTCQDLPQTAPALLASLENIHLTLANRVLTSTSVRLFAESLNHLPDQQALYRAFQEKYDLLKLKKLVELYGQKKFDEIRPRARAILDDPNSTVETKFWAQMQLLAIDHFEAVHAGKPQADLPKISLAHAKGLQVLTASGPKYLKFYALIARQSAELAMLVQENYGIHLALQQHLLRLGNPRMVLGLYARRSVSTKRIVSKYNRCIRLARYAANYPDRWVLGRALTNIVNAIGPYIITVIAEGNFEAEHALVQSALQICKLAAWISNETGDLEAIELAIISALLITRSQDSDAYRWAHEVAQSLPDPEVRQDTLSRIERAVRRWKGERVEGDYHGNVVWQAIQNMAAALGIDLSKEDDPLVRGLKIAATDNSPERVLINCERLLVSQGATGPIAREIKRRFNLETAGSKVVHCTLHNYHEEGKQLDAAYANFKMMHCDSCPDKKPRAPGWRYEGKVRLDIEAKHSQFVGQLIGTKYGFRLTKED